MRRVETTEGIAYAALLEREKTPEKVAKLKRLQRDGGERAVRDYVEGLAPSDVRSVQVVYDDPNVQTLLLASKVPVELVAAERFLHTLAGRGRR